MKYMKQYILIKDWVDVGHAVNIAAHAALIGHKNWSQDIEYLNWYNNYFRKVACKVTDKEFEKAKEYDDYAIVTESAFDDKEVALVFKPRWDWPKFFKFIKLYK